MEKIQKKASLGINLLILISAIIVTLIGAEVILRLAWGGYRSGASSSQMMVHDDTLGWVGKPNFRGQLEESGVRVYCELNRWGFRDKQPLPPAQVGGKRRVMFLGDSFVMGTGVEQDVRVSKLIEDWDSTCVAYNFGILGYSTDQELLVLRKYGPEVKPSDVLLFFCANDLVYNDSDLGHRVPKPHFHLREDGTLSLGNVPVPELPKANPVLSWLSNELALGQLVSKVQAGIVFKRERGRRRPTGRDLGLQGGEEADLDSLLLFSTSSSIGDLTYYLLKEMRDECRRLGARLVLFTTPSNHHWTASRADTPEEIRRVLRWCSELGIEAVDLFPVFHQDYVENGKTLYIGDKMHWNARGNRVAARVVQETLHQQLMK